MSYYHFLTTLNTLTYIYTHTCTVSLSWAMPEGNNSCILFVIWGLCRYQQWWITACRKGEEALTGAMEEKVSKIKVKVKRAKVGHEHSALSTAVQRETSEAEACHYCICYKTRPARGNAERYHENQITQSSAKSQLVELNKWKNLFYICWTGNSNFLEE